MRFQTCATLAFTLFARTTFASPISPLFGLGQESFSFSVLDVLPQGKTIEFDPNIAGVSRLGINAFGFAVGYSFRSSDQNLDPKKGSTQFFDLQLGYNQKQWGVETFYQTYQGFYTSNTNAVQLFPDLRFVHYGLIGRYALSDGEFSVPGLMDQSDDVKTTSGKYYVLGGLRYHSMESSTSLLQQENMGQNPEFENLRLVKTTSINLGVGAGKYWVSPSRFFAGGLFDLVGTVGIYNYTSAAGAMGTTSSQSTYATLSYDLKLAVGYSGDFFKSGIGLTADTTTLKTPGATFLRPSALRALTYIRAVF